MYLSWLFKNLPKLLITAVKEYLDNMHMRKGAALAYYALFSMIPILYILILLFGWIVGSENMYSYLDQIIDQVLPDTFDIDIKALTSAASETTSKGESKIGYWIGTLTLLYSVTAVFNSLKGSFNDILGTRSIKKNALVYVLYNRGIAFVTFIVLGFVIMLFFILQPFVLGVTEILYKIEFFNSPTTVSVIRFALGLFLNTLFFMLLYGLLPDKKFAWKTIFYGGLFTAMLFLLGQYGVIWYLGRISIFQQLGAAGAFLVILVWVFYSAQIVFFGANLIKVIAYGRLDYLKKNQISE